MAYVAYAPAVGIPDPNYGQEIMACVVLKPGSRCTVEELAAFSQRERGKYEAPKVIKLVADLPKGPSGMVV
jgi:long-chain acyl-CoA synthetase